MSTSLRHLLQALHITSLQFKIELTHGIREIIHYSEICQGPVIARRRNHPVHLPEYYPLEPQIPCFGAIPLRFRSRKAGKSEEIIAWTLLNACMKQLAVAERNKKVAAVQAEAQGGRTQF